MMDENDHQAIQSMAREIIAETEVGCGAILNVVTSVGEDDAAKLGDVECFTDIEKIIHNLAREVVRLSELLDATERDKRSASVSIEELKIELAATSRSHERRMREMEKQINDAANSAWEKGEQR